MQAPSDGALALRALHLSSVGTPNPTAHLPDRRHLPGRKGLPHTWLLSPTLPQGLGLAVTWGE